MVKTSCIITAITVKISCLYLNRNANSPDQYCPFGKNRRAGDWYTHYHHSLLVGWVYKALFVHQPTNGKPVPCTKFGNGRMSKSATYSGCLSNSCLLVLFLVTKLHLQSICLSKSDFIKSSQFPPLLPLGSCSSSPKYTVPENMSMLSMLF